MEKRDIDILSIGFIILRYLNSLNYEDQPRMDIKEKDGEFILYRRMIYKNGDSVEVTILMASAKGIWAIYENMHSNDGIYYGIINENDIEEILRIGQKDFGLFSVMYPNKGTETYYCILK